MHTAANNTITNEAECQRDEYELSNAIEAHAIVVIDKTGVNNNENIIFDTESGVTNEVLKIAMNTKIPIVNTKLKQRQSLKEAQKERRKTEERKFKNRSIKTQILLFVSKERVLRANATFLGTNIPI